MATMRVATTRHRDTYHPIYLLSPTKEREAREQKQATSRDDTQDKLHIITQLASKICTQNPCKTQLKTPQNLVTLKDHWPNWGALAQFRSHLNYI